MKPQQFPVDEKFNRALNFMNNMKEKHGKGFSNVYVIQKVDLDGNIIDEYYCENMLTDYGMSQFFINNVNFPKKLYIGNGSGSFNHTTNTLLSPITDVNATVSNDTVAYNYPLYYDNISGLITCVCKFMDCYFDYNITGITTDVSITEYGIGTAYNALWTHSWVYDTTGAQTFITKKQNERLNISVYMCMSYYETLITNDYSNGRYTIITSMERFFNKMNQTNGRIFKRFNTGENKTTSNTSSGFMNNEITRFMNFSAITMYDGTTTDKGYIDGFAQYSSGFLTIEREILAIPEPFDVKVQPINPTTEHGLSDMFGSSAAGSVPITQATVTALYMFNHKTNEWTNSEIFTNDNSRWYTETPMNTYFAMPIYYTNNNTVIKMYVYQNLNTTDPIVSVQSGIGTIYATNKYWETNSWVLITDFNNIPPSVKNARYWITTSNSSSITPVRASTGLRIVPTDGGVYKYSMVQSNHRLKHVSDNYQYKWYKHGSTVYSTENQTTYTIGNDDSRTFTYGKWMCVFNSAHEYLTCDMSNLSTTPIQTSMDPPFTSTTLNMITQCYRTETKTGYICLQSTTTNESVVINLKGNTVTQTLYNTKLACCVWGEDKFAYIPADDLTRVEIYNFETSVVVRTFNIPTGFTPSFMFAHNGYVWMTNGTTASYVMSIEDGTMVASEITITINSTLQNVKLEAVDDVMIIYRFDQLNSSTAFCVKHNDPTKPFNLSGLGIARGSSFAQYILRYVHGTTLALLQSAETYVGSEYGTCNAVFDFGQFLNDGSVSQLNYDSTTYPNIVPYGESYICKLNIRCPIENFVKHRIVGTTKTITAMNHIKNITGKQFSVKFTNIPEFLGLPPGNVQ